ncbi:54S ribosomal protein L6, mitochondrial [[Candida] anglica]|uniref:54S ribosomal protein L6, mitochondrial n=1 Tax=[Candida] anglica TaxID=148631 RepID=A0ABP0EH13_9ASCO
MFKQSVSQIAAAGMGGKVAVRSFSVGAVIRSNIGKAPIRLGEGIECYTESIPYEFSKRFTKGSQVITLDKHIVVKGPKGVLRSIVPNFIEVENKDGLVSVSVPDAKDKIQRSMWGTTRALLNNNVIGVTEGHLAIVKFVGTGYRATIEDLANGKKQVVLKIGYPYMPALEVPEGLTVTSPNPTRLIIEGINKHTVTQFASKIREFKKPEPYKGKGIYVNDETIKLKEKKIK